jgi:hypothetical protein
MIEERDRLAMMILDSVNRPNAGVTNGNLLCEALVRVMHSIILQASKPDQWDEAAEYYAAELMAQLGGRKFLLTQNETLATTEFR